MYELNYSIVVFISILMIFFGYIIGNTRKFNIFSIAFIGLLVLMFMKQFNYSQTHLIIIAVAFAFGYFLPHLHVLSFIGDSLSDFINGIRYRDNYRNIKLAQERLQEQAEELEKLRQAFEKAKQAYEEAERVYNEHNNKQKANSEKSNTGNQSKQQGNKKPSNGQKSNSSSYQRQSSGSDDLRIYYLNLLGLDPNKKYTLKELKKSYKRMHMKYHPDRNQDKSIEELRELNRKMVEFQKAFEWLRDND
ncbi:hypothetical protein [uncultured Gammaproteobacteria bacterium]|nr:hypothetical protein [uncultured Gammaproteobacteria bacterium]